MMRIFISVFFMLFANPLFAQTINSEELANFCKSGADSDKAICTLVLTVYKDGFIEGVAKGVMDTYKYDKELYEIVKNIKAGDFAPRLNNVVTLSTCIQKVPIYDLANSFIKFVDTYPSASQKPYRETMWRVILKNYCYK